jgi:hypothetical protein
VNDLTPSAPLAPGPYRVASEPVQAPAPFDARELWTALLAPHRAIDLVLADRARLARTIAGGRGLPLLAGIMLVASALFSVPYALVFGTGSAFRVSALFLGSVAVCVPSLHVFTSYLGFRIRLTQNLVMALVVSSVASMFALAFAPIIWFVQLTTTPTSIAVASVSIALLTAALFAGLGQLARILAGDAGPSPGAGHRLLMAGWQTVVILVTYRMALFLGLV